MPGWGSLGFAHGALQRCESSQRLWLVTAASAAPFCLNFCWGVYPCCCPSNVNSCGFSKHPRKKLLKIRFYNVKPLLCFHVRSILQHLKQTLHPSKKIRASMETKAWDQACIKHMFYPLQPTGNPCLSYLDYIFLSPGRYLDQCAPKPIAVLRKILQSSTCIVGGEPKWIFMVDHIPTIWEWFKTSYGHIWENK